MAKFHICPACQKTYQFARLECEICGYGKKIEQPITPEIEAAAAELLKEVVVDWPAFDPEKLK